MTFDPLLRVPSLIKIPDKRNVLGLEQPGDHFANPRVAVAKPVVPDAELLDGVLEAPKRAAAADGVFEAAARSSSTSSRRETGNGMSGRA